MGNFDLPRRSYVWTEVRKRSSETTIQPEEFKSPENFIEVSNVGREEKTNFGLNYKWVRKLLGFYLILIGIGLVSSLFLRQS